MAGPEAISRLVERVLRTYATARSDRFGREAPGYRAVAALGESFEASELLRSWPSLQVRWSVGQGNWASVPWIAFLDERETSTAQRGVFAILLFREDLSGAYIGISQGVATRAATLRRTAADVRAHAGDLQQAGFSLDGDMDLRAGTTRGRNYERSIIASKLYERGAVPDDAQILADLEAALLVVDRHISGTEANGDADADTDASDLPPLRDVATAFRAAVETSGMAVPAGHGDRVLALLAALVTKPFVILTGLSGSGKTQLALRLGEWFGDGPEQPRMLVVPVRPDWTGPEALFGYEDALRPPRNGRAAWFVPRALELVLAAARDPELPYLLLLDEMNLAHVERYFSDFLSGVESRQGVVPNLVRDARGEWRVDPAGPSTLPIPRNLFVIGTVNVDETTYLFSPKVLDRATTFEVRTGTEELAGDRRRPRAIEDAAPEPLLKALTASALDDDWQLRDPAGYQPSIEQSLIELHRTLAETGDEFGHRVFYESLRLATAFELLGDGSYERALDHIVLLKLLPRVHGSRRRVEPVLRRLRAFAYDPGADPNAPPDLDRAPQLLLTAGKVERMLSAVAINQFVSFTE